MYPIKKKTVSGPDERVCAELLENVYSTSTPACYETTVTALPFSMYELGRALKCIRKKKSADHDGIMAEMFIHGSCDLRLCLLRLLNDIVTSGSIPNNWYATYFCLLHKGGDPMMPITGGVKSPKAKFSSDDVMEKLNKMMILMSTKEDLEKTVEPLTQSVTKL